MEEGKMGPIGRIRSFFLEGIKEEDSQPAAPLPNLPLEITAQILPRLPVQSLLRLLCVCKSWRSLISDPKFARTHLSLASAIDTDFARHGLLITASAGVASCSLHSVLNEHSVEVDYLLGRGSGGVLGVRVLGCCDGLMCIEFRRKIYLWNPLTRKSKRLPSVDMPLGHVAVYGFGHDNSTGDYKVVRLVKDRCNRVDYGVKVYSLNTDSWRRIGDFPDAALPHCYSGLFVNGALHWNVRRETNWMIVSLDLANETYGEVLRPEYQNIDVLDETLCALNGCLCVLYKFRGWFDLWVMKEYGSRESWTKLAVVPYVASPLDSKYDQYAKPLCILKNGEVVLHSHKLAHLVRYDPKVGTYSYQWSNTNFELCSVYPYVESLVSLDVDHDRRFHGNTNVY